MPYLYILECADGTYYTGSTWDLERRLWQHQNGEGANYTAKHLPVKLVYCEQADRIEDAYRREKQIQGWSRKKKQALIAGDVNRLHELAACRNPTPLGFARGTSCPSCKAETRCPNKSETRSPSVAEGQANPREVISCESIR